MSKRKSRGCGFPFLPQVPLSRPPTEGKRGETPICVCVHEQARGGGGEVQARACLCFVWMRVWKRVLQQLEKGFGS